MGISGSEIRTTSPWVLFCKLSLQHAAYVVLVISMLTTVGCGGCNSQSPDEQAKQEEEEKKKKEEEKKKKKPLEVGPLLPQLGHDLLTNNLPTDDDDKNEPKILVKPGHWTPTVQRMKANYEDFVGRSSSTLIDKTNRPSVLQNSRFRVTSSRPVVLAKGRAKLVESELLVPEKTSAVRIRASLANNVSGVDTSLTRIPKIVQMPSYQYFMVVLAKEVSRYSFLNVSDTVRSPWEEEFEVSSVPHYRVVMSDATKQLPLSANTFAWTSIAYLIWDEVDPTRLSAEQQQAMLDWIHWGGRLIVNGPDSLETLRGSFLDPLLPVESDGPRKFTAADLEPWSDYWAKRYDGQQAPAINVTQPWSGIKLKPKENAQLLAGGSNMFCEWRVGQGSVLVSAIQLAQRDLVNWPGFDGFLNNGLLRRPRRQFIAGPYEGVRVHWADYARNRLDAHFITPLRMFARDAARPANYLRSESESINQFGQADIEIREEIDRRGGVGAWSPNSPVSLAAREVLEEAGAVRIPDAGFVLGCLVGYLLILVPANWIIFRTLQKVEWAWISAPVIAVLGTYAIVHMVQLDIGFVRSQTEVALLELHGNHNRGMLSRYTGLYSSLSTTYDITFEHPTAVALPFSTTDKNPLKMGDRSSEVIFEKNRSTFLRGLTVSSASRRTLRSEEMIDLTGTIRLGRSSRGQEQLENFSGLNLRQVAVIHRSFDKGESQYRGSWIGSLRSGNSAVLGLTSLRQSSDEVPFSTERQQDNRDLKVDPLLANTLLKLAFRFPDEEDLINRKQEEYRMVAVLDQIIPGTDISPSASQVQGTTIVVAHLKFGDFPPARPDVNSRFDVVAQKE